MGRQRNNPQSNGKEQSTESMLKKIEATKLSDIKFKILVIRMLKELSENYKKLSGNYISMKKDIETMKENQVEMKNIISEMKNTEEGIKSRLDEAEDQSSEL